MSLKNEASSDIHNTKSFYREYVAGMNRERLGREFHADTDRLKQLYKEATGEDREEALGRSLPVHVKVMRLFSSLARRLNPTRRLIFGLSVGGFVLHHFVTGLLGQLLLPFSFAALLMILMVELLEKSDVQQEIDLARQIQLSLLPATEMTNDYIEVYSFANTANEVGGDYVDMVETDRGTYIVIADVSGKGLTAALYMVRMQALVHLLIEKNQPTPKELLVELNDYVKSGVKDKTFVTACAAFFPKDKSLFSYARAGHNPPIYFNKEGDSTYELRSDGFALGMTSTAQLEEQLIQKKIRFEPGDSVLFYTDGLTEARNEYGDEFGVERLDSILDIYGSLHAKTVVQKVQDSLEAFIGTEKPADDVTFTCVHRSGKA